MKGLTIPSIFTAVNKYSGPLSEMEKSTARLTGRIEKAKKVSQGAFIVGTAIAAPLVLAVSTAVKYESALASLSAITGVTGAQFETFRDKIEQVSKETKRGPIEVSKAFELAGSAMPELLKSADALSSVSKASITLSKASGDELENSIRSLTGVMNQFSYGAEQSEKTINILAAGAKSGAASIVQTSESMVNFGSVAAGANMSLEQTVAAIQVMSKFSLFGAEAGTKLRGSVLKLQQAGIGYKSGQFQVNDALEEAKAKMDKLQTAKQRDAFATKLFGAENISTGKILLANIGLFKQYTKEVTGTNEANTQAAIKQNTMAERMKAAQAQMQMLSITIGEKLLPYLNKFMDKVIPIIEKTIQWTKENSGLVKTITVGAAALAAFVFAVSGIAAAVAFASKVMLVFNLIMALNPAVFVAVACIALVAAVVMVIKKFQEWGAAVVAVVAIFLPAFALIISLAHTFIRNWDMIVAAFKDGGIIEGLKAIGKTLLDVILLPLQQILEIASNIPGIGKFAASGAASIKKFRADLGLNMGTAEAVNPKKNEQELADQRTQENARVQLDVNDPTGRVKASSNNQMVRINMGTTMDFGNGL